MATNDRYSSSAPLPGFHRTARSSTPSRLDNIQVLRAVAAAMVVLLHTQFMMNVEARRAGLYFPRFDALPLGAGVDLFFVISGFIIVYASERLFGTGQTLEFLRRRILRIVPLYWAALVLRLMVLGAGAMIGKKAFPDAWMILTSFFFIPYDSMGFGPAYPFPILDLGWSLNYEMLFYVLFSGTLALRRNAAVAAMGGFLLAAVVLATIVPPTGTALRFWTHPMTLEFAAGAGIAVLHRRHVRLETGTSLALALAGIAWWWLVPMTLFEVDGAPGYYSWGRVVTCGIGAMMLVAAAALQRRTVPTPIRERLATLGDSSYSQYLIHPFILLFAAQVVRRLPLTEAMLWPLVLVIIAGIVAAAHVVHLRLERPVVRALQTMTDSRRPPARVMVDAN